MQPTSPLFKEAINLLIDVKFEFEVVRGDWLELDDPRMYMMPENTDRTELPRFLQVQLNNIQWVVYDYDTATLINVIEIVKDITGTK